MKEGEAIAHYEIRAPFDGTVIGKNVVLAERVGDTVERLVRQVLALVAGATEHLGVRCRADLLEELTHQRALADAADALGVAVCHGHQRETRRRIAAARASRGEVVL